MQLARSPPWHAARHRDPAYTLEEKRDDERTGRGEIGGEGIVTSDVVHCRKCGAPTRLVILAQSGKGILVDATPRQGYVVIGVASSDIPLVELRDTWMPHTHEAPPPSRPRARERG
jgi:hypothetical protein